MVATLQPQTITAVNPFSGKLTVEVEPRFGTSKRWYLFSANPVFMHAYLNGQRGPAITTREGFNVLGVEFRVVLDFGAGVRDWRFAYTNAGE